MPTWVLEGLPQSIRKTKRKGLRAAKDGLRTQRVERYKQMKKKYSDAQLEEEVKEDEKKQSMSKTLKAIAKGSFKSPDKQASNRSLLGMSSTASSGNKGGDLFNTSASSIKVP